MSTGIGALLFPSLWDRYDPCRPGRRRPRSPLSLETQLKVPQEEEVRGVGPGLAWSGRVGSVLSWWC